MAGGAQLPLLAPAQAPSSTWTTGQVIIIITKLDLGNAHHLVRLEKNEKLLSVSLTVTMNIY